MTDLLQGFRDETSLHRRRAGGIRVCVTAGCATYGPQDYQYTEARAEPDVAYGTVESVRPVRLGEDRAPVGTVAGAGVGGLIGNTLFHGAGRAVSTVVGAVAGGVSGNALEHHVTEHAGAEIVVRFAPR